MTNEQTSPNAFGHAEGSKLWAALGMIVLVATVHSAHAVPSVSLETLNDPVEAVREGETRTYRVQASEPAPPGGLEVRVSVEQEPFGNGYREIPYTRVQFLDPRDEGERVVRIGTGETAKEFTIRMTPSDGIAEWPRVENFELRILDDPAYTVGTRIILQVMLDDVRARDARIRVVETSTERNVDEDAGFVSIAFRLETTDALSDEGEPKAYAFPVRRSFAVRGTTSTPGATEGADYRSKGPGMWNSPR